MRVARKEILDKAAVEAILSACQVGRLGTMGPSRPAHGKAPQLRLLRGHDILPFRQGRRKDR